MGVKRGVLPLSAATGAISVMTALTRSGHIPLTALAPSAQSFGDGRVWLVLTSALVADRPTAASILGFLVIGLAALALCGPRVLWLAAISGHVGSALTVYAAIALARVVDPGALQQISSIVDYGTSAVVAAWIGVLAYRLWERNRVASVGLCVLSGLAGWLLRPDLTLLDSEHGVALLAGVAVAHYGPRLRRPRVAWGDALVRARGRARTVL